MAIITKGFLTDTVNGLKINSSYPCNSTNYKNTESRDVKYVVIHYTGNANDNAINNCKYFQNGGIKVSAHFFVDETNICQSVELRDIAYHCGTSGSYYHNLCRNANSFAIEMTTAGNYIVSEKTQINSAYLCAHLCKMIGVTADMVDTYVLRHYDVTHKNCPAQYVSNSTQWVQFKTWVKNILKTGNHTKSSNISTTKPNTTTSASAISLKSGTKLTLKNVSLYISSTSATKVATKTGTYYIWNGNVVNNRIRITNSSANVGKSGQVTGWINYADAKNSVGVTTSTTVSKPQATQKSLDDWARDVINGKYGNGVAKRTLALKKDGCPYSYKQVQARVNQLLKK